MAYQAIFPCLRGFTERASIAPWCMAAHDSPAHMEDCVMQLLQTHQVRGPC